MAKDNKGVPKPATARDVYGEKVINLGEASGCSATRTGTKIIVLRTDPGTPNDLGYPTSRRIPEL